MADPTPSDLNEKMKEIGIFLVEDRPILAEAIMFQLEKLGYGISGHAATAEEALEKFEAIRPDLAFLDIDLGPGMNGVELARKLREDHDFPFIFLTGIKDEALIAEARACGAVAFLEKPATIRSLVQAIQLAMTNMASDTPATPFQPIPKEPADLVRRPDFFFIRWQGKYQKVQLSGIQYIEASESYSIIRYGDESYTISTRIKDIENRLESSTLVRVHRSYIVNVNHVSAIEENTVHVGGKVIPIGGTYREKVRSMFNFL